MNIILLSKRLGCSGCLSISRRGLFSSLAVVLVLMPLLGLFGGYYLGSKDRPASSDELALELETEIERHRQQVRDATRTAEENMDALARRLGQLQAHVIRLDALGERLVKMADLDKGEFDFAALPAQGGPESSGTESLEVADFVKALRELSDQLEDRSRQLSVLETMMMNRQLQAEVMPTGRPIERGWLSSFFGNRTDPFSGRRQHHSGVDFAGKEGSNIVAVAAGVVTFAGRRSGYGNTVEVNHGSGYVTRYAHNKENTVEVGDTVKKGQVLAIMGSTGRSTGPHVHFEVLHNGKAVDPKRYIHAAR